LFIIKALLEVSLGLRAAWVARLVGSTQDKIRKRRRKVWRIFSTFESIDQIQNREIIAQGSVIRDLSTLKAMFDCRASGFRWP
jgi:hypothetical protein